MNRPFVELVREVYEHVSDWLSRARGWQVALAAVLILAALPMVPALLMLAVLFAIFLFARAWVREFAYLMRLGDDAFPGHNDKLIWAMLMIILAPVGVWLFQSYREVHWPQSKPAPGEAYEGF
jgi:hypothetical protein